MLAGAQQGLDLLARCLIDPGDAVVIDRPGYLGAIQTFRTAGARLVGWDITRADTDELEELLLRYRPKLIYTNPTHQNPTGVTLPIRTRRELLELAARYRVPIVEDDTYRELALDGPPSPPSLFTLDEAHAVVIRINSFSKMLAPGLRARLDQRGPADRRSARDDQAAGRSAHAEPVAAGGLRAGRARRVRPPSRRRSRPEHRRRRDAMVQALRQHVPAAQLRFSVPDGGMYLWCQLPPAIRARAVQEHALRESVMILTGEPFYVDQGGDHQLRICYTSQPAAAPGGLRRRSRAASPRPRARGAPSPPAGRAAWSEKLR